jgi:type III secretory pathway component EscU
MRSQRRVFAQQLSPREQLDLLHASSLALRDETGRVLVLLYRPRQLAWPVCMVRASGEFARDVLRRLQQLRKPVVLDAALLDALFVVAQPGAPIPDTWLPEVQAHLRSANLDRPNP